MRSLQHSTKFLSSFSDLYIWESCFMTPQFWVISCWPMGGLPSIETIWIVTECIETYISIKERWCSTIHHIMVRMMNTIVIILFVRHTLHEKKFRGVSVRNTPICPRQRSASRLQPWCFCPPEVSSIYIVALQNSTCKVVIFEESRQTYFASLHEKIYHIIPPIFWSWRFPMLSNSFGMHVQYSSSLVHSISVVENRVQSGKLNLDEVMK